MAPTSALSSERQQLYRHTSWMSPAWKPPVAARDHLMAGCCTFSVFVFLAWFCALLNNRFRKATLSEMVSDWDTAEGKIFIAGVLLTALFFLLSGYPYVLPNARVDGHPLCHFMTIVRHFFVNAGLILVAFVPTLADTNSDAHAVEVYIHSAAATVAFLSFVVSELFVLSCHPRLDGAELRWRSRALSMMNANLLLLVAHKSLHMYNFDTIDQYSKAWTFRYEMLLGAGLITQNQLIWHFCDPEPTRFKERCFYTFCLVPYLGVCGVIASDFTYRQNEYALPWLLVEVALLFVMTCLFYALLSAIRYCVNPAKGISDGDEEETSGPILCEGKEQPSYAAASY